MAPYVYQPLDDARKEIRVLTLLPGTGNDPIRIRISHVPFTPQDQTAPRCKSLDEIQSTLPKRWRVHNTLESSRLYTYLPKHDLDKAYSSWVHPDPAFERRQSVALCTPTLPTVDVQFEALSYVWGDSRDTKDVSVVSESSTEASLTLTSNLYLALNFLRRPHAPRTLWIDAICINQTDWPERNSQIQRMHLIYKHASRVVVWLGTSTESSDVALSSLEWLGRQCELTDTLSWMPAPNADDKDLWLSESPLDQGVSEPIISLARRPYFQRLWIIQELQYANQNAIVQCGAHSVRWYFFRRGLYKSRVVLPHSVVALATDLKTVGLEQLQNLSLGAACSEPRDRVYALLGLLPRPVAELFQPNYSTPVSEVYKQMIIKAILATQRINLHFGEDTNRSSEDLKMPTWIPVSVDFNNHMLRPLQIGASHAGGESSAAATHVFPDELWARGLKFATVEAVSDGIIDTGSEPRDVVRSFYASWTALMGPLQTGINDFTESFVKTISMGRLLDRWPEVFGHPSLKQAGEALQVLGFGDEEFAKYMDEWTQTWIRVTCSRISGSRLVRTEHGEPGICNQNVQPGDIITVLLGHDYPMLIRRVSGTKDIYRVLGRCYLHSIMDAEALLGPLPSHYEVVLFNTLRSGQETKWRFRDGTNGHVTREDPRLGEVDEEWEKIKKEDELRLSWEVQHWKHRVTGKVINSDPRMLPEALERRGVKLENICLV